MELGMIGLGKMGANMAQRLVRGGHRVVGVDPDPEARGRIEQFGAESVDSLQAMTAALATPRAVWMMVPAGDITGSTVDRLLSLLSAPLGLVPEQHGAQSASGNQPVLVKP